MLLSLLPDENRCLLQNMQEADLIGLHFSVGMYIRNRFGLWVGNQALIDACMDYEEARGRLMLMDADTASMTIIRATWERLRG